MFYFSITSQKNNEKKLPLCLKKFVFRWSIFLKNNSKFPEIFHQNSLVTHSMEAFKSTEFLIYFKEVVLRSHSIYKRRKVHLQLTVKETRASTVVIAPVRMDHIEDYRTKLNRFSSRLTPPISNVSYSGKKKEEEKRLRNYRGSFHVPKRSILRSLARHLSEIMEARSKKNERKIQKCMRFLRDSLRNPFCGFLYSLTPFSFPFQASVFVSRRWGKEKHVKNE